MLESGVPASLAGPVRHLELLVIVMADHLMPFAALFVQTHPGSQLLCVSSFNANPENSADSGGLIRADYLPPQRSQACSIYESVIPAM